MTLRAIDLNGVPFMIEGTTTLDEQINSDTTLTVELFDTPVNKPITSKISESWRISGVNGPGDNVEYVVKRKEVKPGRRTKVITLNCIPYFIEVLNTRRIYTNFEGEYDVKTVLDTVFRALPFSYELNESVDTSKFMDGYGNGQTKLEVFKTALETWELEFKIENGVFKLSKYINRKPDYFISDEINAYNVVQEVDGTNFYTYAKGYGDLSSDDPLESAGVIKEYKHPLADIAQIGIKEAPPLRLEDETNPDKLYSKTKKYVDTSLKISITCDFISLQKEWPQAVPKIADEVMFKANNIDYSQVVRLIAISTKRNHKGDILSQNLTFGDAPLGKRHRADVNHATQYVKDLVNERRQLPKGVLDKATQLASSLILAARTELDFTSSLGIVAKDKTDANNIVVLNSAGVGVSNDGGKTFGNAITGAGINATMITTGTMIADRISGGLLKSLSNSMIWDLNNNRFDFYENSKLTFHSPENGIIQELNGTTAFLNFMPSLASKYPGIVLGTSDVGLNSGNSTFVGFKAQTAKATPLGLSQAEILGDRVVFDGDGSEDSTGTWVLETNSKDGKLRGFYGVDQEKGYKYELGRPSNRFEAIHTERLGEKIRVVLYGDGTGVLLSPNLKNGIKFSDAGLELITDGANYKLSDLIEKINKIA